jgi:predicted MFS family arabinose efflux permease
LLPSIKPDAGEGMKALLSLLRFRQLRMALLTTLAMFVGQFSTYTYIVPFLMRGSHVGAQQISSVLFGYGVASFVGNLIGGWASSKNARANVMVTALLVGGAAALLATWGHQPAVAIACVLAWGLGFGMMPISLQSWVFETTSGSLDNTGSLFVTTAQTAIAIGSLAGGIALDRFGITMMMRLGGALVIASGLMIIPAMLRTTDSCTDSTFRSEH